MPNPHGPKKVLHPHSNTGDPGSYLHSDLIEAWRPEADGGIAREAETLPGNAEQCIQLSVTVLVMHDGQGVDAGRDLLQANYLPSSGHAVLDGARIAPTIGEMNLLAGHANVERPALAAQAFGANLDSAGRRCGGKHQQEGKGDNGVCHSCSWYNVLRPPNIVLDVM